MRHPTDSATTGAPVSAVVSLRAVPRSKTDGSELAEHLAVVLARRARTRRQVDDLARLPGGASRETWSFTARAPTALRRAAWCCGATHPVRRHRDWCSRSHLLEAAAARRGAGAPPWSPRETSSRGAVTATCSWSSSTARRSRAASCATSSSPRCAPRWRPSCGTVLAAVHRIPPASVPGLPGGDPLEQLRSSGRPARPAAPRLRARVPVAGRTRPPRSADAVVHGDFRNGNLIVGARRAYTGRARLGAGAPRRPHRGPRVVVREGVALRLPAARRGLRDRSKSWSPPTRPPAAPPSTPMPCAGGRSSARCGGGSSASCRRSPTSPAPCARWSSPPSAGACARSSGTCWSSSRDRRRRAAGDRRRRVGPDRPAPLGGAPHDIPSALQLLEAVREFLETEVIAGDRGSGALPRPGGGQRGGRGGT